jgi:arylsulfatase B|eukprot:COSAG01_NODE_3604_length_5881_cov_6.368558_6_plen_93_part_00
MGFQSVHGPEEVPDSFKELYSHNGSAHFIATESRRTHQGMVTALDEAVGNLTATFKETGLYTNSLIWFSSDNVRALADYTTRQSALVPTASC